MNTLPTPRPETTLPARTAVVEIVIPVYNEEADLAASVRKLDDFLADSFPYAYRITIADNASTDHTWEIAEDLSIELPQVRAVHLEQKGRGRALKQVWLSSTADVVAYMDVDLSTDLRALLPLVAPLVSGHSDVAIGTRLARSSRVVRGPKREFISRCYNLILRGTLRVTFSDAQCGFKALRRDVAGELLPLVEDTNWFFDTEMLVLAQRSGLRIHEVPVDWVDDPGTTVDIRATAVEDLRGVWRLFLGFARRTIPIDSIRQEFNREVTPAVPGVPAGMLGQLVRFGLVGIASTAAYFVVYLALRGGMGAQAANLAALLITAVANTAANRRLTFGVSGRTGVVRDQLGGLAAFAVALGLTSGTLWLLQTLLPGAARWVELTVLVMANAAATLFRFLALRLLLHHRRNDSPETVSG